MWLNGLSSLKTETEAAVSILLDDSAKKGKLSGITVGGAKINITSGNAGVTVEITEGTCTEVNAEQDNKVPAGLNNSALGIRG